MRAARATVPARQRAREAELLTRAMSGLAATATGSVCAYSPTDTEPGSSAMLDALRAAGLEVLLPLVPRRRRPAGERGPLDWAPYEGLDSLTPGPFGVHQPRTPRRGPAALATAAFVLVPALAVDRRGTRLGYGAGWYDRSLPLTAPLVPLIGVVRDQELVGRLPREHHDVRLTAVLTPERGVRGLPLPAVRRAAAGPLPSHDRPPPRPGHPVDDPRGTH